MLIQLGQSVFFHNIKGFIAVMDALETAYIGGDKPKFLKRLNDMGALAKELGCTQAQLALAWVIANKDVSTCIVGASKPEQMSDNLGAIDVVKKWTPEIEKKMEEIMGNKPPQPLNWRTWSPLPDRRNVSVEYAKKQ